MKNYKNGIGLDDNSQFKLFSIYDIIKNNREYLNYANENQNNIYVDFTYDKNKNMIEINKNLMIYYILQYKMKQIILPFSSKQEIEEFCFNFQITNTAKIIAKVKGKNYQEFVDNYLYLRNSKFVDKIAFELNNEVYLYFYANNENENEEEHTIFDKLVIGRSLLIKELMNDAIFTWKKKHILFSPENNFNNERDIKIYKGNSFESIINKENCYE